MAQTELTRHTDDLRSAEEGDDVTLVTTQGGRLEVTCDDRTTHHSDERDAAIYEQTAWTFIDSDGTEYRAGITDGLSPHPDGGDAYPSHFPLHRTASVEPGRQVPDEAVEGYVEEVLFD